MDRKGKLIERGIRVETYNMVFVGSYYSATPYLDKTPDNVVYVVARDKRATYSQDHKISFYLQSFDVFDDNWYSHRSLLETYSEEIFMEKYPYEVIID